jgi:hypothetical protein
LSFGKEYEKLMWEYRGKLGRENRKFWHLKIIEMTTMMLMQMIFLFLNTKVLYILKSPSFWNTSLLYK